MSTEASPETTLPPGGRTQQTVAAIARLAAVVFGGLLLAIVFHGVDVLVVVLAFAAIIMLHELGHFITAKASGMKVTEYFLGFGPRIWSIRLGETEYGVKAIPAGGYVKIVGMTMLEEVDPADEERSYRQSSFPRRLLVAVAGSAVHMLLALVLLWSIFAFTGNEAVAAPYVASMLRFSTGTTPAEQAGFRDGDSFVSVDGTPVKNPYSLGSEINSSAGKLLTVVVRRGGRLVTLHVRPVDGRKVTELYGGERQRITGARPIGIIGIGIDNLRLETTGVLQAIPRAFAGFGSLLVGTGRGIADVFSFHGLGNFAHSVIDAGSSTAPSGGSAAGHGAPSRTTRSSGSGGFISIVGAIQLGSQAAQSGDLTTLLRILALVNISVGLLNLFPMLPLDGGHVAIAVYERARSRRGRHYHADITKLMPVAYVFLIFIVVIGLGALYANVVQPVHLPGG